MCGAASPWETRLHQPAGSEHVAKRGQHRYRRPGFGGLPLPGGLSTAPGVVTALEPGSWVAWHAWWSRGSAFDWEFVLSESDGGTHLVQRTAWYTALLFRVLSWPLVLLRRRQMPVENRRSLERIKVNLEEGVRASTHGAGFR